MTNINNIMQLILGSLLLSIVSFSLYGQEKPYKYPLPEGLDYTRLKITDSPKEIRDSCLTFPLEYYEDTLEYLACLDTINIDYFYPVGWSRAGAFAFVQVVDIDGHLPSYEMYVTNYQIEASNVSTSFPTGFAPVEDFDDLYDFWNSNQDNVNRLIKLHNIAPKTIVYTPIEKLKQRSDFKLKLVPRRGSKPYGEPGTFVYKFEIKLNLDKEKERSLYKYEYGSSQRRINDVKIAGMIKSPFKKTAILVLAVKEWVKHANQHLTFKLVVINW